MIPLCDVVPSRTPPRVTLVLLVIIGITFVAGARRGVTTGIALFTSPFSVADPVTLAVTLLLLWIFGDRVEDRLGHLRYAALCATCTASVLLVDALSPMGGLTRAVGATAMVSGIAAAYFTLNPQSRILLLVPVPLSAVEVPAVLFLGFWVVLILVRTAAITGAMLSPIPVLSAYGAAAACGATLAYALRRAVVWS